MDTLLVFALNDETNVRHTYLTRAQGDEETFEGLAAWLGVSHVDPGHVELFPISDLGPMSLSEYVAQAYDIEPWALNDSGQRLNALEGDVLLVREQALGGSPTPGPQATLIAAMQMITPDHSMTGLAPADLSPADDGGPANLTTAPRQADGSNRFLLIAGLIFGAIVLLCLWLLLT